MFLSTVCTLRLLCPSMAQTPTFFRSVCLFPGLLAVTLECVKFHRRRCTDGLLRIQSIQSPERSSTSCRIWWHSAKRCPLMLSGPLQHDTTKFQRVTNCLAALGFIDHDLSLNSGDGMKEVSFKRRTQNLCQLPNHSRFAGRLLLVHQCSPGFKSFTLFVGENNFQRCPLCRRESMRDRRRLQHSSAQHLKSQIQLCHGGFISRLGFHCSDDFLHSSTLEPSCPDTTRPGPVTPSSVFANEALWFVSRRKRSKSESSIVSSWCLGHLCPARPTPPSGRRTCHTRLGSIHSFLHHLPSFPMGFQILSHLLCSFLALSHSFVHFHQLLDLRGNLLFDNSGLTTQTQTNQESTTRSSARVSSVLPNSFGHDEFS